MVAVEGTVLEALPHALYRVGDRRQRQVTAHAPSGPGKNFIRVLVGDRVRLELIAAGPDARPDRREGRGEDGTKRS